MSSSEIKNADEPDFCWGKKRGVGRKKKDVKFYESFTYDGVEYALYDCVYMSNEQSEEHPHIGKLIRIWEAADKSKKIKVQWFFRASEISHWLSFHNLEALENELFFATGEGLGLANVNPLEAIAGKCFVVCISRDSRNPQPSAEHLQMADYVFYRTFDVRQCVILDEMHDRVGGLEVKYLFNKQGNEMITGPKIGSEPKEEDNRITVVFEEALQLSGKKPLQVVESIRGEGDHNYLVAKEDMEANYLLVKDEPFGRSEEQVSMELSNEVNLEDITVPANEVKLREPSESDTHNLGGRPLEKLEPVKKDTVIKGKIMIKGEHSKSSQENLQISTVGSFEEKRKPDTGKDILRVKEDTTFAKDSSSLDDRPSKILKGEDMVKFSEFKKRNHIEEPTNAKVIKGVTKVEHSTLNQEDSKISTFDSLKDRRNSGTGKNVVEVKDTKYDEGLDDRPLKKPKVEGLVQLSKVGKKNRVEKLSDGGEVGCNNHMEKRSDGSGVRGCLVVGSSADNKREAMLHRNSTRLDDGPSKEHFVSKINKSAKTLTGLEKINTKERLEQKVVHDKNMSRLTRDSSMLVKGPLENTKNVNKSPSKLDKDPSNKMHDEKIREHNKDSFGCKGPSKKSFNAKSSEPRESSFVMDKGPSVGVDGSDKGPSKDKIIEKSSMPMKSSLVVDKGHSFGADGQVVGPTKENPMGKISGPVKSFITMNEGPSEKKLDKMSSMLPECNSSKISKESLEVGKIYEVMRRPNIGKGKWFKSSPWENMKDAHAERRVILLQNLDPEYTSGEVEDILWSAFKEDCTVKMVQRTAFSSPHYGQALVILKTREAAERVVGKLNDGCLLISNQRALVASIVNLPQSIRKQGNFVGHLVIDRVKLQMLREQKDARSTSHYSQPNTIEYEFAMEWCLLQSKYDFSWESLHKDLLHQFSIQKSSQKSFGNHIIELSKSLMVILSQLNLLASQLSLRYFLVAP